MNVNNLSKSEQTYNLLKKGLDASATRSKISANNIANFNTKGYKKYNVSFEEYLQDSVENMNLKTTNEKHIKGETSEFGDIKVQRDTSSSMRADGNNVDVENEMSNQAANAMMYNALISQVSSRLSMERYVISEGRR
jgi:flagellar basal-body rod protein FlgB